jgi:uncharacterized membrane protein
LWKNADASSAAFLFNKLRESKLPLPCEPFQTTERITRMEMIEKSVEVEAPVSTVYNQWTQFEEFPRFMKGVKEVRQLDDKRLHWKAEIAGKDKEWDAEIYKQEPDEVIAWRSTSGAQNAGEVKFDKVSGGKTRVTLVMEYEPEGAIENIGDAVGAVSMRVQNDLDLFKELIEERGRESGAWRGEIQGGKVSND